LRNAGGFLYSKLTKKKTHFIWSWYLVNLLDRSKLTIRFVCLSLSDWLFSVWLSGDSFLARFLIIIDDVAEIGEIEFVECFRLVAERDDVVSFKWISDRRLARLGGVIGSIFNSFLLDNWRFNKGVLVWGLKEIIFYIFER
jgi:hypothetical protein